MSKSVKSRESEIEKVKQENRTFSKFFNPLIVYIRKPGFFSVKATPEDVEVLHDMGEYDNSGEIPDNLWESFKEFAQQLKYHRGKPLGVVVVFKDKHNETCVGWSKCNFAAGDKWNKHLAVFKAIKDARVVDEMARPRQTNRKNVKDAIAFALKKFEKIQGKNIGITQGPCFTNGYFSSAEPK